VFGHKWEPAEGTILDSRIERMAVEGRKGVHPVRVYTVEVRTGHSGPMQVTVPSLPVMLTQLGTGTVVQLEINPKTNEVRFDPAQAKAHIASVRDAVHVARELRTELDSGDLAATIAQLSEAARDGRLGPGVHISGTTQVHVAGSSEVHVVSGAAAADLMKAALGGGGDPAAAMEKLKQLTTDLTAQAGDIAGLASLMATGQSESTDTGPAPSASPVEPEGFSSGASPSSFAPVTPAPAAQPASFDTFGLGSKADRIARLQDQRDRGQLTEQQFQEQRQKIQDEF
jgi:hypothetical protein